MISYVEHLFVLAGHLYTIYSSPYPTPLQETLNTPRQVWLSLLWGSLLLSPGSWDAQGFVCAPQAALAGVGFDFNMIVPLLPPHCDFFVLGHGTFIWWVSTSSCQWLFSN